MAERLFSCAIMSSALFPLKLHQTVQIRTLSLLEMGSDLLFSLTVLISIVRYKLRISLPLYRKIVQQFSF